MSKSAVTRLFAGSIFAVIAGFVSATDARGLLARWRRGRKSALRAGCL